MFVYTSHAKKQFNFTLVWPKNFSRNHFCNYQSKICHLALFYYHVDANSGRIGDYTHWRERG